MKRNPRKTLKNKLDKVWSLAVRAKYPRCVVCGGTQNLSSHHCIATKGSGGDGVRWLVSNGVTLCYRDHICKYHSGAGKEWMDMYWKIINELISHDEQQNIIEISHRINKYSISDMEDMLKALQNRC